MVSFLERSAGAADCECVPIPARFGTHPKSPNGLSSPPCWGRFLMTRCPQDRFIREKFTRERIRQEVGRGIFPALSKGAVPDRSRELAPSAIAKHRIHDEAAARADRRQQLNMKEAAERGGLTPQIFADAPHDRPGPDTRVPSPLALFGLPGRL
jgi:hypothetical protein